MFLFGTRKVLEAVELDRYTNALAKDGMEKSAELLGYIASYSGKPAEERTYGDVINVLASGRMPESEVINIVRSGLLLSEYEYMAIEEGYSTRGAVNEANRSDRKLIVGISRNIREKNADEMKLQAYDKSRAEMLEELKKCGEIGYAFDIDEFEEGDTAYIKNSELKSYLDSLVRDTGDTSSADILNYLAYGYTEKIGTVITVGETLNALSEGQLDEDEVVAIIESGAGMSNPLITDSMKSGYRTNDKIMKLLDRQAKNAVHEVSKKYSSALNKGRKMKLV
ncbi:MAG: hypothetical protein J7K54_04115 [Candidatus Aenigmarchaeota archaeon]|nr:hypothetical protein [Candidatus Aenigmarchaeota archaeon]